jgi:hypothetical protein
MQHIKINIDICITEIYRSLIKLFLMVKSVFPHVASSIPAYCGVYSIQHYVIMFFCDLWHIAGFLHVLRFFSIIKTDLHDISEILLKVALSEIIITPVLLQKIFVLPFMFCLLTFYHLLFHYFHILKFG